MHSKGCQTVRQHQLFLFMRHIVLICQIKNSAAVKFHKALLRLEKQKLVLYVS